MSEQRDPLDDVFGDAGASATEGKDTVTGSDTATGADTNTQTTQEAPGNDSVPGAAGDDKITGDTKEVKMVPLAALEEARRTLAEERQARIDGNKGADTNTGASEPVGFRDPKEDPDGWAEDVLGSVQLNIVNSTLNMSEKFARKEHGVELVDQVREWALKRFETDPAYASRILADPDPYETAIADYKKEQLTDKAGKIDPEILAGLDDEEIALLRQHRASKTNTGEDTGADTGGSTAKDTSQRGEDGKFVPRRNGEAPPRSSIAAAPGGGKSGNAQVAAGEGTAFDETFK